MKTRRIISGLLTVLLAILLGWCMTQGVGDGRTIVYLCIGIILGTTYTFFGRLPIWLISASGGSLSDDDDPANISAYVYLPIIVAAILLAVIIFVIVIFMM